MIVAGDYRLLPESNDLDIHEDISDFWTWVRNDLQSHITKVKPGIEADLSETVACGESVEGTLASNPGSFNHQV
jgi:hypothetical protein